MARSNVFTQRISMALFCLSHTHTHSLSAFADTDTNISVYPLSHCSCIVKCQKAERGKCQLNRSACSPAAAHNHSRPHTYTRACTTPTNTHTHTTYSHLFSKHSVMHYGKGGPKVKFMHSVDEIQLHILFVFHYYYYYYMYIYLYLCMSLLLYAYIKIYMDCNL